jgi:prolipoprotein diacylglyceryl transferase
MRHLFASIPSPPSNVVEIGPLTVHYYGIAIGVGVAISIIVLRARYERFGGNPAIVDRAVLWVVGIGFLGARAAYVITHTGRFEGRWYAVFFVWEGGLALFGGLTAGALTAIYLMRKHGGDIWAFADGAAVGIPLAQACGRLGNYFNQELFGTPSSLPWAVEIDPGKRPVEYLDAATFHPTFLYEMVWNLAIVLPLILLMERRGPLGRGGAIGLYAMLYGLGRFLLELLRTDTTFRLLGVSRNGWVAVGAMILGVVIYARSREREPHPGLASTA